jgi:hypothetical protein
MRQEPMVADGNADVLTEDPEHGESRECLPGEEKEGSKGEDVEEPEDNGEYPFEWSPVLLRHVAQGRRWAVRKCRRGRNFVF